MIIKKYNLSVQEYRKFSFLLDTTNVFIFIIFKDSVYIQECVPENLDLKIKVWTGIDNLVDDNKAILASSSSCILPSKICKTLKHREQFIVAHPVRC